MEQDYLKQAELKNTKKRRLILSVLEKETGALTADELYNKTRNDLSMSVSTIYRSLNALSDKDIVMKYHCQDGKTRFQLNRHQHQHQLVCAICKEVVPIDECPLEDLAKKLMEQTGYSITGHFLEFTGVCPKCRQKEAGH